eukprot:4423922-Amphidinium_carterae.1
MSGKFGLRVLVQPRIYEEQIGIVAVKQFSLMLRMRMICGQVCKPPEHHMWAFWGYAVDGA